MEEGLTTQQNSLGNHQLQWGNRNRKEWVVAGTCFVDYMQAVRYFALMFSGASYTTAAFLQDSGLKRPFIITSDTGVLLGISFEVGQLGIEMSRPVTFRSKTFQGTLLTFCPILEIFGENLRLEECRMLGITDYFATITDDGKPGRALKIGWFLNEFFWDPGMNNSKGISEVPLSFSSC